MRRSIWLGRAKEMAVHAALAVDARAIGVLAGLALTIAGIGAGYAIGYRHGYVAGAIDEVAVSVRVGWNAAAARVERYYVELLGACYEESERAE